jgi:hypothetical protein
MYSQSGFSLLSVVGALAITATAAKFTTDFFEHSREYQNEADALLQVEFDNSNFLKTVEKTFAARISMDSSSYDLSACDPTTLQCSYTIINTFDPVDPLLVRRISYENVCRPGQLSNKYQGIYLRDISTVLPGLATCFPKNCRFPAIEIKVDGVLTKTLPDPTGNVGEKNLAMAMCLIKSPKGLEVNIYSAYIGVANKLIINQAVRNFSDGSFMGSGIKITH